MKMKMKREEKGEKLNPSTSPQMREKSRIFELFRLTGNGEYDIIIV